MSAPETYLETLLFWATAIVVGWYIAPGLGWVRHRLREWSADARVDALTSERRLRQTLREIKRGGL